MSRTRGGASTTRQGRPTGRDLLVAAWIVAIVATLGSLTYSNVLGLVPCRLCWFQRVFMYPLVLVVGAAVLERRPSAYRLVLVFSVPGAAIAAYQSYLQIFEKGGQCTIISCSAVHLRILGLSIPNQSLLAFLLITLAMVGIYWTGGDLA